MENKIGMIWLLSINIYTIRFESIRSIDFIYIIVQSTLNDFELVKFGWERFVCVLCANEREGEREEGKEQPKTKSEFEKLIFKTKQWMLC